MLEDEIENYISELFRGNRRAVARLITLVENGGPEVARNIIAQIFHKTGKAYIIGITGAPGSGKSTLTSKLAGFYLDQGLKVGVICVDPTSPFSGGALLGDRIRMKSHFTKKNLFLRSMANRGKLGGLSRTTKEAIHILDAYGCDIIIVETVGVGQSEIDIFKSAHTTLVLVVPGLGDDIQAIKAGIMEITDIFVVNKCDLDGVERKINQLESMLDLSEQLDIQNSKYDIRIVKSSGWRPPVVKTNALTGDYIPDLLEKIQQHRKFVFSNGIAHYRQLYRYKHYIVDILRYLSERNIEHIIFSEPQVEPFIEKLVNADTTENPYSIAEKIYGQFFEKHE